MQRGLVVLCALGQATNPRVPRTTASPRRTSGTCLDEASTIASADLRRGHVKPIPAKAHRAAQSGRGPMARKPPRARCHRREWPARIGTARRARCRRAHVTGKGSIQPAGRHTGADAPGPFRGSLTISGGRTEPGWTGQFAAAAARRSTQSQLRHLIAAAGLARVPVISRREETGRRKRGRIRRAPFL